MTINEIIDEIQAESVISLSDADMLNFMKSALRQISTILQQYRCFLTEGTLSFSTLDQTKTLPTGFILERNIWYVQDGQRIIIGRPQSSEYFMQVYTTNGSGKPDWYRIYGTTLQLDKPADTAFTVGLDYFKEISSVVLGDTFLGDERVIQACKHLCKAEYYGDYEEDEVKSNRNRAIGTAMLTKIAEDYESQEMGGNVEIKEYDGF